MSRYVYAGLAAVSAGLVLLLLLVGGAIGGAAVRSVAACSLTGSPTQGAASGASTGTGSPTPAETVSKASVQPVQPNAPGTPGPDAQQNSFTADAASLQIVQAATAEVKREGLPERADVDVIAAGLAETGLTNDDGGTLDSEGYLQQRPSQGWGDAAQIKNVSYATESFLHHLVELSDWNTRSVDVAVESVQRGAPAAGNGYGNWEEAATQLANQFWSSTPAATTNPGAPGPGPVGSLGVYPPGSAPAAAPDAATPQGTDAGGAAASAARVASGAQTSGVAASSSLNVYGQCSYGVGQPITLAAVTGSLSGKPGTIQKEGEWDSAAAPTDPTITPILPGVPAGGDPTSGFPFGQCTWWAAYNTVVTWHGNAADWWNNSPAARHSQTPAPGDIVVYGSGGGYSEYGHVGVVIAVQQGSFTVSEMNYIETSGGPPPAVVDERVNAWPDPSVDGFITPVAASPA